MVPSKLWPVVLLVLGGGCAAGATGSESGVGGGGGASPADAGDSVSDASMPPDAGASAPCVLDGAPCPASLALVPTPKSILGTSLWGPNGDTYGPVRGDLAFVFAGYTPGTAPDGSHIQPRAFASTTTGIPQVEPGVQLRIQQTDGTSPCSVDDKRHGLPAAGVRVPSPSRS